MLGAPQGAGGWGPRHAGGSIRSTQGCCWRDLGALGAPQGAAGAGRIQDDAGQQPVVVAPVPDLVELPRGDGGALLVLPQRVQLCGAGGGWGRASGARGPHPHPKTPGDPPRGSPVKPPSAMLNMNRGFSALSSRRPLARGSSFGSFSAFTSSARGGAGRGRGSAPHRAPLPSIPKPPAAPPAGRERLPAISRLQSERSANTNGTLQGGLLG